MYEMPRKGFGPGWSSSDVARAFYIRIWGQIGPNPDIKCATTSPKSAAYFCAFRILEVNLHLQSEIKREKMSSATPRRYLTNDFTMNKGFIQYDL